MRMCSHVLHFRHHFELSPNRSGPCINYKACLTTRNNLFANLLLDSRLTLIQQHHKGYSMASRPKRNSIVIPDDSSEDSSPPAQIKQEDTHDTDSEVSVPLAQMRSLRTPTTSPLSTPPSSPTLTLEASASTQTTSNLQSTNGKVSAVKLSSSSKIEREPAEPNTFVQVNQEKFEPPPGLLKNSSPPPDFSLVTHTGPDRYPSPVNANASLTNPPIQPPPTFEPNDLAQPTEVKTDMNERRAEFKVESAKHRADARESANDEEQPVHAKVTDMQRNTQTADGADPVQVAPPPAAPTSAIEGVSSAPSANQGLSSVNQNPNGGSNENGLVGKVETLPVEETLPKEPTITDVILTEVRTSTRVSISKASCPLDVLTS